MIISHEERFDIAADLREIASLLKIKGRIPSRRKLMSGVRGATALENHEGDFDALVKTGRLKEIAGIGNALAAIIEEVYRTGECWLLVSTARRGWLTRDEVLNTLAVEDFIRGVHP